MAQAGYTPISLYYSTTAAATPSAGNLVAGELALNTVDEKLYFKNSAGTVKLLASNATSAPVLSFSAGTTGFTPSTATSGAITLAGTLATTNGGTGLTSFTSGGVVYASSSSALATGSALVFDGTNLGIGSTSPVSPLTINGNDPLITLKNAGTNRWQFGFENTSSNRFVFYDNTAAAYRLIIDSSGNLGLGVTPSAWSGFSGKPLQLSYGSLFTDSPSTIGLVGNAYYNGGWKYYGTGLASIYQQATGAHFWYTAASGTAGNAVSFTQVFGINASGAFGVGSTPSYGTSGQVLTSGGSAAAPTWTTVAAGSAATPTALGTVYASTTSTSTDIVAFGYQAGNSSTGSYSTAIGYQTMLTNSGAYNTAIGYQSLQNPTGGRNVAIGRTVLQVNTSGNFNVGIGGANTLGSNTTGANNVAVGDSALVGNTTGGSNVAIGVSALQANTTTSSSTAIGYQALYSTVANSSGLTAIGYQAGLNLTAADTFGASMFIGFWAGKTTSTGTDNHFIGTQSGQLNTSGSFNTGVGLATLQLNTTGSGNYASGYQALRSNTTASSNTAVGREALYSNTTGSPNLAIGYRALYSNTTASYNIGIGSQAGYTLTTGGGYGGQDNVFIGADSGYASNSSAWGNIGIGVQTLLNNTSGAGNVAIGGRLTPYGENAPLQTNTTGSHNIAIGGFSVMASNTTGQYNVALSPNALRGNTTGEYNIAIGSQALRNNTTSSGSVAIGNGALLTNTAANQIAIGNSAGYYNTTGDNSTFVGASAGTSNTTGSANTFMGYLAGNACTTGNRNTCVGFRAGQWTNGITTGSTNTYIGSYAYPSGVAVTKEVVIGEDNIGKGSSTFFAGGGSAYNFNNTTTWSTTSDQRLKKNIVDNNDGLDKINAIRVRNFEYRLPNEVDAELKPTDAIQKTGVQLGVIAQELQVVLPECVKTESTGVMSVDTDNLIWYAINAIKELKAQNDSLKARLDAANL